jgi:hypothetical protein
MSYKSAFIGGGRASVQSVFLFRKEGIEAGQGAIEARDAALPIFKTECSLFDGSAG